MELIKNLIFIFMPHYWLMNDQYSQKWDECLNDLLDKYEFTNVTKHTANLGDTQIWIANYPYACFTPWGGFCKRHLRASRLTILRAKVKLGKIPKIDPYDEYINQLS